MAQGNLSIHCTWENIKSAYNSNKIKISDSTWIDEFNSNKFKISDSSWNDEFNMSDGSYSISSIQDYLEYIIKKHETVAKNLPV